MSGVIRDIKSSITRQAKRVEIYLDSPKTDPNSTSQDKPSLKIINSLKKQLAALKSREELLRERELLLKEKEQAFHERDEALKIREEAIRERNEAIKDTYLDALTGCRNRNYYENFIKNNSNSNKNHNLIGLVYIDINGLKKINDLHGHEAGDKAIKDTARFLERHFRKNSDKVVRLGGDEFVVICINQRNDQNFEANLVKKIKDCCLLNPPAEFSYGVAVFNKDIDYNLEYAKNRADKAMYQCKMMSKQSLHNNSNQKRIFDIMSRKVPHRKVL